jgi:DNA-directed RNA polymerase specialized sigma24 family protein
MGAKLDELVTLGLLEDHAHIAAEVAGMYARRLPVGYTVDDAQAAALVAIWGVAGRVARGLPVTKSFAGLAASAARYSIRKIHVDRGRGITSCPPDAPVSFRGEFSDGTSPLDHVAAREQATASEELDSPFWDWVLALLTERQRQVLLLRVLTDLTFKEIGRELGLKTVMTAKHFYHAVDAIRAALGDRRRALLLLDAMGVRSQVE